MSFRRFRRRLRDSLQSIARFDLTSLSLGGPFKNLRRWQRKRREAATNAAVRAAAPVEGAPLTPLPAVRPEGFFRGTAVGRFLSWPFVLWSTLLVWSKNRLVKLGMTNAAARGLVLTVATMVILAALAGAGWVVKGLLAEQRIRSLLAGARQQEKAWSDAPDKEKSQKFENAIAGYALVLRSRPNNVEANERLADLLFKARSANGAIFYHKRLAELFPEDLRRKLRWTEVALAFNQRAAAEEAMAAVPAAQRKDVGYLRLQATLQAASGRTAEVEDSLRALLAIKPDDAPSAVRLAALQLTRTRDPESQARLRAQIEPFLQNREISLEAARVLAQSYFQAGDANAALRAARVAADHPESRVSDGIMLINILQTAAPTLVEPELAALKDRASSNPADAFEVSRWILNRKRYAESDQWLMSLKPEVREAPVLLVARADTAMAQGQWDRLEALTSENENWGEMEVQRIAFSARAARERGQAGVSRTRWAAALRQAGENVQQLRQLRQVAAGWNWADERVDVEWQLVKVDTVGGRELLSRLYEHYRDRLDTPGLRRVFEKIVEIAPDDNRATRNLALLYLMGRIQVPRAHELAMAAHIRNPADVDSLVCYAFAVHVKGETDEALRLMDPLAGEIAKSAYLGGYYALVLAAKGRYAEARPLLKEALTSQLLPEEAAAMRAELDKS